MSGDWFEVPLGAAVERVRRPIGVDPDASYSEVGIRSFGKGFFEKDPVRGRKLGNKKIFEIRDGDLVFNIVFAWEGAVGLAGVSEDGRCGSHRFPTYRAVAGVADARYLLAYFQTRRGVSLLGDASPGSAGRNRTLNQGQLLDVTIALPPIREQQRVADLLAFAHRLVRRSHATGAAARSARDALRESLLSEDTKSEQVHLGDLVTLVKKKVANPSQSGAARYVGLEHLDGGDPTVARHGDPSDVTSSKGVFSPGDILFGKLRPYLRKVALAPWGGICSTDILVLRPNPAVDPRFLQTLLASDAVIGHAIATSSGTKMPRTTFGALEPFQVRLPDRKRQELIAELMTGADRVVSESVRVAERASLTEKALRELLTNGEHRIGDSYDRFLIGSSHGASPDSSPAS